ncbi:hypothetical protein KP509_25G065100 [Ceratopteris richardii]|uniref:Uncharacterized protein n=1 Tax=Ceratopteris richardii TaxID=49495 RepID=A0A8T2RU17_CERRI|nr:hypothetical protein KP509_25G065100 [Ceratopteris richardii]
MKKRRIDGCAFEEVERNLHSSFCPAANSISQLYTHAQNQNKIAFNAGQRDALKKLFDYIQFQQGGRPSMTDISNYLKVELENLSQVEISMTQVQSQISPSLPQQHAPSVDRDIVMLIVSVTEDQSSLRKKETRDMTFIAMVESMDLLHS